jgi:hypothetical protein
MHCRTGAAAANADGPSARQTRKSKAKSQNTQSCCELGGLRTEAAERNNVAKTTILHACSTDALSDRGRWGQCRTAHAEMLNHRLTRMNADSWPGQGRGQPQIAQMTQITRNVTPTPMEGSRPQIRMVIGAWCLVIDCELPTGNWKLADQSCAESSLESSPESSFQSSPESSVESLLQSSLHSSFNRSFQSSLHRFVHRSSQSSTHRFSHRLLQSSAESSRRSSSESSTQSSFQSSFHGFFES